MPILGTSPTGQGDQRHLAAPGGRSNLPGCVITVELPHTDIEKHDVGEEGDADGERGSAVVIDGEHREWRYGRGELVVGHGEVSNGWLRPLSPPVAESTVGTRICPDFQSHASGVRGQEAGKKMPPF